MSGTIARGVVESIIGGLRLDVPHLLPSDAELSALLEGPNGVPLGPYRAVLDRVLSDGGGAHLLRAGRTLNDAVDPFLFVLLNSDDASVLVEKEQRLQRYFHSRHEIEIVERGDRHIVLRHCSGAEESPRPSENLASCGQHIALLEQLGHEGLRLRLPESADPELLVLEAGTYRDPTGDGGFALWHFDWDRFTPTRRPLPGLDELLLARVEQSELQETARSVVEVERVLRRDLGRSWTVAQVAGALDTSARSLQRALSDAGTSFSAVVDRVRLTEARRLIESSALTLTEIGYVCGFADSAHFSRRFKQRFGVPPSRLRGHQPKEP